ncbi:MAG TPA: EAL domain-containing protein [Candidatus Dormibacteraeota bacterium]|jgi:EAL domain-containing protein (putative c-di-GMP-specific phosphodiesterase class I)|nr:EAL domain-containing protein [Candidatus Dormibacteraeota bacterium]
MPNGPALTFGEQVFALSRRVQLVGRGDRATNHAPDLDLADLDEDRVVSRRHAQIEYIDGHTVLTDLGSTNGTFVNDRRLPPNDGCHLTGGERVRFGHLAFEFQRSIAWPPEVSAEWESKTVFANSVVIRALGGLARDRLPESNRPEQIQRIQGVLQGKLLGMVFQPIVDLVRRETVGVESLARFSADPPRSPDKWFNEAHAVGLGAELELVAMADALDQLRLLPDHAYMSINSSPETALSEHLATMLSGVPLDRVVLEVTEHAAVSDYEALLAALVDFRAQGLRLAVDDMGSGYANMKHILRLAPDIIKLDVDLIRGIDGDPARRALAGSLSAFAHQINAKIVAEGVENEKECAVLIELGVPLGQGFFFARPGPLPLPRVG